MFKKLIFLVILSASFVFAGHAEFAKEYGYESNFQTAFEKSKLTKKPMMILFVTTVCPWCKKLEYQTLQKQKVADFITDNFIPVLLDKENSVFPKELMPKVVPTVVFYKANSQKVVGKILGFKHQDEFLELLQTAQKR